MPLRLVDFVVGRFPSVLVYYYIAEAETFLLGGRNTFFNIGQVTVTLSGREYHRDIPEGERFFTAVEVDSRTEENRAAPEALRFYDRAGNDLTEQIRWN